MKIRCVNCGRIEIVPYAMIVNGEWKCVCGNTIWEEVE